MNKTRDDDQAREDEQNVRRRTEQEKANKTRDDQQTRDDEQNKG